MGPLQDLGDEVHVVLMRDDLVDAQGNGLADAAGVVEVMVRHDELRDRLVRPQLLRSGPDCPHALGVVRLDDHQMIVELDDQAVMRCAGDAPQAFRQFLCRIPGRSEPAPSTAATSGPAASTRRLRGGERLRAPQDCPRPRRASCD